jgi:hypothetical protein
MRYRLLVGLTKRPFPREPKADQHPVDQAMKRKLPANTC